MTIVDFSPLPTCARVSQGGVGVGHRNDFDIDMASSLKPLRTRTFELEVNHEQLLSHAERVGGFLSELELALLYRFGPLSFLKHQNFILSLWMRIE